MGLKKYEIITVGSDKRVRALRSWQVGDRYVNIGDVGGIVYDDKTLSQDGACWLFRGNFGFPGARIGGDSVVDVTETALATNGSPNVDILGSSTVVGAPVRFSPDQTSADAIVLTAADFEQGFFNYTAGANWETWKGVSNNYVRSKAPIFLGGAAKTIKLSVPGFVARVWVLDRDGIGVTPVIQKISGAGVTLDIPSGYQYFVVQLVKEPFAPTVPADATDAQITFTGTYETKLVVVDSRLELNPANGTGITVIRPGGTYTVTSGAKYPDSIIGGSRVSINVPATRDIRFMSELLNVSAKIDITNASTHVVGRYSNVKNLVFNDLAAPNVSPAARDIIQATDCNNFAVSTKIFPGMAAAQTANMPFIFQGCNVPNGIFYHHAQIASTYKNIDFAKASVDLGKQFFGGTFALVSSEVEGMYRLLRTDTKAFGCMVESYESVRSLVPSNLATTYGTTIYADAYFNGLFDIAGTNVFGNTKKHDTSNTQDVSGVLVKGLFNATTNGSTISGIEDNNARAVVAQPFRVSGAGGVSVSSPAGVECNIYLTDATNKIIVNTGYVSGNNAPITPALPAVYAYVAMRKTDGSDILSMDEFRGVTVTTYNGCKIVNTGETAVNMKGNIRVEGNAVASGLLVEGSVFMSDNASFTKTAGVSVIRNLKMTDNGQVVLGDTHGMGVLSVTENARLQPTNLFLSEADLIMSGSALVTAGLSISGILRLKDNARVTVSSMTTQGDITVCGSYSQSAQRRWVGKRVIDNENAPEYDNNVKTKYDF